jgi:hypothetical protein
MIEIDNHYGRKNPIGSARELCHMNVGNLRDDRKELGTANMKGVRPFDLITSRSVKLRRGTIPNDGNSFSVEGSANPTRRVEDGASEI